jgi:serine/threonine protein kinase
VTGFQPQHSKSLRIASTHYEYVPHPIFANSVFVLEGSEAFVYQLRDPVRNTLHALKVMKPSFRGEYIAQRALDLSGHQSIPGLYLCNRVCLTRQTAPDLISAFPEYEYAIFMPWLQARTWAGFIQDKSAAATYVSKRARVLALQTARVLQYLETHHMAHTDIAGGNIFLSTDLTQVQLLDLEGMYYEGGLPPRVPAQGSPGYQHRHLTKDGQYCPSGDRFAGAILLTEMLTWSDPVVRALTPEDAETLFQPQELQTTGSPLWQAVRASLFAIDAQILDLFDRAWASSEPAECPDFNTWKQSLKRLFRTPVTR